MSNRALKALTLAAFLALPIQASAQDAENDVASTSTTTADNKGATDDATDWGWLGLLGLGGLAGLLGKRYLDSRTTTTPTTTRR